MRLITKILLAAAVACITTKSMGGVRATQSSDHLAVDTGRLRFGLGTGAGATLHWVEQDGRRVVERNAAPLLSARLMESATYDGLADFVPDRRFLDAAYRVARVAHRTDTDAFVAEIEGALHFDDADRLPFTIRLTARTDAAHLEIDVQLSAAGEFRNRFLRNVTLRLPLELEWRKRVAQGGDQGLEWDTRYYYEFPGRSGILPHPDRNEFRYFAVEQDAPRHFRIWRAESASTPELTHQHGIRAAGWSSVYDHRGGLLFALRNMADTAPKSLEVDAADGGEARIHLHPETAPAFRPLDPEAARHLFGVRHA
ncbi:MAG: hypothetical protein LC725_05795, partial [Lentisphaerae bacterium]|nr:hypothetical protein [Lentisphaerota bacterium]